MVSELRNLAHHSIIETVRIYITVNSLPRRWSGGIVVSVPDFRFTGMGEFKSYIEWNFLYDKIVCVGSFFKLKMFKMLKLVVLYFFYCESYVSMPQTLPINHLCFYLR